MFPTPLPRLSISETASSKCFSGGLTGKFLNEFLLILTGLGGRLELCKSRPNRFVDDLQVQVVEHALRVQLSTFEARRLLDTKRREYGEVVVDGFLNFGLEHVN